MTEAEKRALALQIMKQEQARLASSSFRDHRAAYEAETHQRIATRQQYYNDFAKQGITFQEFQKPTATLTNRVVLTCSPTGSPFSTPRRR